MFLESQPLSPIRDGSNERERQRKSECNGVAKRLPVLYYDAEPPDSRVQVREQSQTYRDARNRYSLECCDHEPLMANKGVDAQHGEPELEEPHVGIVALRVDVACKVIHQREQKKSSQEAVGTNECGENSPVDIGEVGEHDKQNHRNDAVEDAEPAELVDQRKQGYDDTQQLTRPAERHRHQDTEEKEAPEGGSRVRELAQPHED